jgi:hypothetical protein
MLECWWHLKNIQKVQIFREKFRSMWRDVRASPLETGCEFESSQVPNEKTFLWLFSCVIFILCNNNRFRLRLFIAITLEKSKRIEIYESRILIQTGLEAKSFPTIERKLYFGNAVELHYRKLISKDCFSECYMCSSDIFAKVTF